MNKKYNILERIILAVITKKVRNWFTHEKEMALKDGVIKPNSLSPEKTWPNPDKFHTGKEIPFSLANIKIIGKYLKNCVNEGEKAIKSLNKNRGTLTTISDEELIDFKNYAKSLGVGDIGFAKVPNYLIFKERAISYENAIVMIMEMDRDIMAKAPSLETFGMVFETYDRLGIITNKLTTYLRDKGFNVHGGHPLGGLVLYPPLAKLAGLGWLGNHGLLITKMFGSRQRISAIFTDINNLPLAKGNDYKWIGDFCNSCNKCVRKCPPNALRKTPIIHESGRVTHLDRPKCLPYFVEHQGCSICVKVCVFSNHNYDDIKSQFEKSHGASF